MDYLIAWEHFSMHTCTQFFACFIFFPIWILLPDQGILKGEVSLSIDLLFDWFGISCTTTDNFCFYLQNRLIQTSQTGGKRYSDTSPFSIPWPDTIATINQGNFRRCVIVLFLFHVYASMKKGNQLPVSAARWQHGSQICFWKITKLI